MFWLLTLPFRILFFVLFAIPFFIVRMVFKLLVALLLLPFFLLAAVAGVLLAIGVALFVPIVPFVLAALAVWILFKILSPRPAYL